MPDLHLLGTGAALADGDRTTTMLAFEGRSVIVVDCGGDVVQRLLAVGIDLDRIAALIVTHEHPDHVSGFPLFMEKIWLAQRQRPIPVCGPKPAIDQARRIFDAFDTRSWKDLPPIEWVEVPLEAGAAVWSDDEWQFTAAPGIHSVPVVGLRVEHEEGGSVAYSSDTERSEAIVDLARDVDLLVHEGTGDVKGHISPAGAAGVARDAGTKQLVLVHLPPGFSEDDLRSAREVFEATVVGKDGDRYPF
ncbi:MAG: MBL fold metallo-hydrolase [Gemmatimonas sp.]|nr:MBL fold metallo-hydrolase [Gemmatimonas sp.]